MVFTYVFTYFLITLVSASVSFVILRQLNTDMGTEQEMHAFRSYLIGILFFTLSNTIWVWINYGYLPWPGWPFSMANLIAICVASYYWFKYIELRLDPALVSTRKFRIVSLLPLYIAVALVLTTPFTKLVFHYEGNEYIHGPLYPTMAVLALLYLIVASVHIFLSLSKVTSPSQRRQYNSLMLFLVFPMAGGIIDIIVPNLPVMELMLLFGTVLVYTNMLQSQINSDTLTGLNNRRLADEYLTYKLKDATPNNPVIFFIGDADHFKSINDEHGHLEGDRALKLIAETLRRTLAHTQCHIARWGGDEFVIIADGLLLGKPEEIVESVNNALAETAAREKLPYKLRLTFGWVACSEPGMQLADVLRQADELMYQQKSEHASAAS